MWKLLVAQRLHRCFPQPLQCETVPFYAKPSPDSVRPSGDSAVGRCNITGSQTRSARHWRSPATFTLESRRCGEDIETDSGEADSNRSNQSRLDTALPTAPYRERGCNRCRRGYRGGPGSLKQGAVDRGRHRDNSLHGAGCSVWSDPGSASRFVGLLPALASPLHVRLCGHLPRKALTRMLA